MHNVQNCVGLKENSNPPPCLSHILAWRAAADKTHICIQKINAACAMSKCWLCEKIHVHTTPIQLRVCTQHSAPIVHLRFHYYSGMFPCFFQGL